MDGRVKYSIECWLYHPRSGRFLLLLCPATSVHGEYWQPVTGGRLPHEDPRAACVREVEEETGVVLSPESLHEVLEEFCFCIPETQVELRKPVYLAAVESTAVRVSSEHLDAAWFAPDEVPRFLGWDSYRQTFAVVREAAAQRLADTP